jgi:hypothetical protein
VAPPKLSKAARRKLVQLQRDKAAREQRAGVLAALSDTAIPADQVSLYPPRCRPCSCSACPRLLRWGSGCAVLRVQLRCADVCAPAMQAALLRGTALRGQRPTKRQRLRRELLAQRLGLALQVKQHFLLSEALGACREQVL